MPDVTVSILTHSQLGRAKTCIAAIMAGGEDVKFILTANGNPEAAAYFSQLAAEFPNITVVVNPNNEGFWKPNNHALTLTDTRWLCLVNDDLIVPKGWLTILKKPFLDYPGDSVFSCPDSGCSELLPSFHGKVGRKEYCEGSCLMIDTAIAKKHGLFLPLPGLAYGEDSYASLRFRELGYRLHWVPLRVNHAIAQTSRGVPQVRIWQSENHGYLVRRWEHYLKVRTFGYPIVVKRGAAHGDVLLTTPIVRALHERSPLSPIYVETLVPQMYANHPFVTKAERRVPVLPNAHIIDLNNAYESHPDRHIIASYALRAELENVGHRTELYLQPSDEEEAAQLMPDGDWVAVHCGTSTWKSKEWPADRWATLISSLRSMGLKIVLVGMHGPKLDVDQDRQGTTTIHQMAALIKRAKLFIGLDSLPFHCAEAVGTPAIGLFGITDPKYISTRNGGALCVCSPEPSFGLRHRIKNATVADDGGQAMRGITVDMVLAKVNTIYPCPVTS